MASGLQATKRRINSVNSTKKITNAMKLVATAKLKTWKNKLLGNNEYASSLHSIMNVLLKSISQEDKEKVFGESKSDSTLFIVVTSTLGLCGGYNYNLYKEVIPQIDKNKDKILVIGTKGYNYFKRNGYEVDDSFISSLQDYDYNEVRKINKKIMSLLNLGEIGSIKIAYTHFKNSITFIPTIEEIYPISHIEGEEITQKELEMLIEPSPIVVLENIVPLYIESLINSRLIESSVSEQASRSNAMESATDNAEEIINKLQIEYNKARQQTITQEITEIVGGANAQS
ncbi:MAG: ATP synthase F1 subunit gamma [Erysipelotrichaceae bacterium]|nr:ATP synthase F1 subunit gamma [Erysipelotrichaceae bacterium]